MTKHPAPVALRRGRNPHLPLRAHTPLQLFSADAGGVHAGLEEPGASAWVCAPMGSPVVGDGYSTGPPSSDSQELFMLSPDTQMAIETRSRTFN